MESELHTDSNCQDEDHCRDSAQFDPEDTESSEQLTNYAGDDEDDESRGPGRHQQDADDEEDCGNGRGQGKQEVEPQPDVLLPEGEGDAVRKVEDAAGYEGRGLTWLLRS